MFLLYKEDYARLEDSILLGEQCTQEMGTEKRSEEAHSFYGTVGAERI